MVGTPGEREPDFDWSCTEDDDDAGWIPPSIDLSTPSPARIYDYALGGKDNFAVDRAAVEQVAGLLPEFCAVAQANRGFLVRAARAMAAAGIRQYLDLGTGIPTSPSVHEVVLARHPDARIVYVDNDPIVMAQNRARHPAGPGVVTLLEDLRDPAAVLGHRQVTDLIDFDQPAGLIFSAVLHFVRRDVAPGILTRFCRSLASGSHVVIATACTEGMTSDALDRVESVYQRSSTPIVFRSRAEVSQLFEGLDLIRPGLADVTRWRARGKPLGVRIMAGVGVKP